MTGSRAGRQGLPEGFFRREDESSDDAFYGQPRFTTHIDDATIGALTRFYGEALHTGDRVLDLMSSWISHLPTATRYRHVAGHGMNEAELARNERLDEYVVRNLNENPVLPWPDGSFDAVLIAVSVQYLTEPFEVFAEIARVLAPGGQCIVAMSHRLFPTKAIRAFTMLGPEDRCRLVGSYMTLGGNMTDVEMLDRSPGVGSAGVATARPPDPLWIVRGRVKC